MKIKNINRNTIKYIESHCKIIWVRDHLYEGYYWEESKIGIQQGRINRVNEIFTLLHEFGHYKLHSKSDKLSISITGFDYSSGKIDFVRLYEETYAWVIGFKILWTTNICNSLYYKLLLSLLMLIYSFRCLFSYIFIGLLRRWSDMWGGGIPKGTRLHFLALEDYEN